jgi:hypothetical protein
MNHRTWLIGDWFATSGQTVQRHRLELEIVCQLFWCWVGRHTFYLAPYHYAIADGIPHSIMNSVWVRISCATEWSQWVVAKSICICNRQWKTKRYATIRFENGRGRTCIWQHDFRLNVHERHKPKKYDEKVGKNEKCYASSLDHRSINFLQVSGCFFS